MVTPGQMWDFLTQIGVEGHNGIGSIISHLEDMEQCDAAMFVDSTKARTVNDEKEVDK
ncbi:hypothetical protein Ancab_014981, partial [Ancistrocladus abbreviatus]